MANCTNPTASILRQFLRFDEDTGKLFWRRRSVEHFKSKNSWARWNNMHAGKQCFTQVSNRGYLTGKVCGKTMSAHRVAWAVHFGSFPENQIDHINGQKTDNRISNLRDVRPVDNQRNLSKSTRNTSGVVGVSCDRGTWVAYISTPEAGQIILGRFKTKGAAIQARRLAEEREGYHPNHGKRG